MLIELHHADMLRIAYVICADRALAEDAVQEAWRRAWKGIGQVRDEERIRPWLLRIAGNEARRIAGRRRNQPAELPELRAPDQPNVVGQLDLHHALARLSPADREMIVLRYVVGYSGLELASLMSLRPDAVRSRLSRLVRRLREEIRSD